MKIKSFRKTKAFRKIRSRKIFKTVVSLGIISALVVSFAACSKTNTQSTTTAATATALPTINIKVGFCAGPYADMFKEAIQPSLEKKGYKIENVEFSDYVQPNKALANKEIDVNLFQHSTYLTKFSADNNLQLTALTEVPTAGMGIFSSKYISFDEVPNGATVAIPNDATNLSRAIRVLEQTGLVKIDPAVEPKVATQKNLIENKKNLKFVEIEAPQLPRSLDSVNFAIINGNYAIGSGLKLSGALYNEKIAEGYVNVIAVRTEDKDSQLAKDILEVVKSDAFKKVIEDPTKQYSSFHKPKKY